MGGKKGQLRDAAQNRSMQTIGLEHQRAADLHNELASRGSMLSEDVFGEPGYLGSMAKARESNEGLRDTGGFDPAEISRIKEKQDTLGSIAGWGREGYQNFADTGGFTPEQQSEFLRSATAPTAAMYARTKDEMARRLAIQGGYSPGYTAGMSRATRQGAQDISAMNLQARTSLADQIRQGKALGLEGLSRTREAIGREQLAGAQEARGLETSIAAGRSHGADLMQRYAEGGVSALNQTDLMELQNRAQSGQLSMQDAQLLAALSSNEKGLFDKIMQGIGTIGGAIGSIGPVFK